MPTQTSIAPRRFDGPPRVALQPEGTRSWLTGAIEEGGGIVVGLDECEALVWASPSKSGDLAETAAAAPHARWVQLPWAGVEKFASVLDVDHIWTCAKGVYAEPVAEMALALSLAGLRHVGAYACSESWTAQVGSNLLGAEVVVVGGGGITEALLRLLAPFRCQVTVVRRQPRELRGAGRVVTSDDLDNVLPSADLVVLALALTPQTRGIIDAARIALMKSTAWLVNVARGGHVVTDDLVSALTDRRIAGAGLDVTDPEPLPEGHPLWSLPNCIITPHTANTPAMALPLLSRRVTENVRRFGAGQPLLGLVDPRVGY